MIRFAHALRERRRWLALLDHAENSPEARQRFRDCGSHAHLAYSPSEKRYYVTGSSCRNRWCPACRVRRQMHLQENLARYFENCPAREWQFITLTVKHSQAPLALQLDWLQRAFKQLRKEPVWKGRVTHGFAIIEITYNDKRGEWHPHLHILAHVGWLDWHALRSTWCRVTHGSNVIDCKKVRSQEDAIKYVLAYMGKPPDDRCFTDDARMIELYKAVASQHLLIRFGKPPSPLPPPPERTLPADLCWLGTVAELIAEAQNGSTRAQMHLDRWLQQRRIDAHSFDFRTLVASIRVTGPPARSLSDIIHRESELARYVAETTSSIPF